MGVSTCKQMGLFMTDEDASDTEEWCVTHALYTLQISRIIHGWNVNYQRAKSWYLSDNFEKALNVMMRSNNVSKPLHCQQTSIPEWMVLVVSKVRRSSV